MSWAISPSRPTTGVAPATGSRALGPTSRETETGAARPFTSNSPSGLEDEAIAEATGGRLSDDDRARLGEGLDSCRDVGRISESDGSRLCRTDEPDCGLPAVDRRL